MSNINKQKSNQLSYSALWANSAAEFGRFYILDIYDGLYKIGISSRPIFKRYRTSNYEILIDFEESLNFCFQIEQILKKKLQPYSITKEEQKEEFGWTETFKLDDVSILLEQFQKLCVSKNNTTEIFKESFNLKYEHNF